MSASSMQQASGMSGGTDLGASNSADGAIDPSQGYMICIKVGPSGSPISVDVQPSDNDGDSDDANDPGSQQVPTIHAALQVAMDVFKHAGQMNQSGAEQDAMNQAYGGDASAMGGQ